MRDAVSKVTIYIAQEIDAGMGEILMNTKEEAADHILCLVIRRFAI